MKKLGKFIKNHKLLVILLSAAIFLTSIWTPVIIVMMRHNSQSGDASLVNSSSALAGVISSEYSSSLVNQTSSTSSVESSSKQSGSSSTSSNKKKNKKNTSGSYSGNYDPKFKGGDGVDEGKDPIDKNAPRIICWGDSITQGMGIDGYSYPKALQKLVGNGYRVVNAGASGEKSSIIAARQGAYTVTLSKDIVFEKDYGSITLNDDVGFVLSDGSKVEFGTDYAGYFNELPCGKVYINNKEYQIKFMGNGVDFLRSSYDKKEVLKKGTTVLFDSAKKQQGSYCEIFYVGANDGLSGSSGDVEKLVNRYKAMAKRHGNDKYMIIIPHWTTAFTSSLKKEFGDKAIDLREEICQRIIDGNGYKGNKDEIKTAKEGTIPATLKANNNAGDPYHFNEIGYEIMGKIVYENGVNLGLWK